MSGPTPSDPFDRRREECLRLHHYWLWFILLGALLMVVGFLAIGSSFIATLATVVVFGYLLLAGGVVQIVNAFLVRNWGGFFLHLLAGLIRLVLGALMVQHPLSAAAGLTLMIAAGFLVGGAFRILYTLLHRFEGWGWVLLNGCVTLLLGLMIWQQWPESSEWVIGLFVGIDLLFNGWSWVILGLTVKAVGSMLHQPQDNASLPAGMG